MSDYKTALLEMSDSSANLIKETFGISIPKTILDHNNAKKVIQVMTENKDGYLASAVLNTAFVGVVDLCESVGPYIPKVDSESLTAMMNLAIDNITTEGYIDAIESGNVAYCVNHVMDCLNKCGYNTKTCDAVSGCKAALGTVSDHVQKVQSQNVGYAVSSGGCEDIGMVLGNTLMIKTQSLDAEPTDDLRHGVFADLTDNHVLNMLSNADTIAKNTLAVLGTNTCCRGVIEGALADDADAEKKIIGYVSEVVSLCSNVKGTVEGFDKNNFDLDCAVTKKLTLENYVPNVTNKAFGWSHESLIMGDIPRVHAITESILGLKEGELHEDMMLSQRSATDDNVEHATLAQNKPVTIDGGNVQYVLGSAATEKDGINRKIIAERLAECVVNTIKWEAVHEEFADLPAVTFINRSQRILEGLLKNTSYYNNLMETWGAITKKIEECAQTGVFNPSPTINELTPAPVGARATQLAFNEIVRAETDDEMDKAMLEFTKVTEGLFGIKSKKEKRQEFIDKKLQFINKVIAPAYDNMIRSVELFTKSTKHGDGIKIVPLRKFLTGGDMNQSYGNFTDDIVSFKVKTSNVDGEDRKLKVLLNKWATGIGCKIDCEESDDSNSYDARFYIRIPNELIESQTLTESFDYVDEAKAQISASEFVSKLNKYHQTEEEPKLKRAYELLKGDLNKVSRMHELGKYLRVDNLDSYTIGTSYAGAKIQYTAEYKPSIFLDIPTTVNNPIEFTKINLFIREVENTIKNWCLNLMQFNETVNWANKVGTERLKYNDLKGQKFSTFWALAKQVTVDMGQLGLLESVDYVDEANKLGKSARTASRNFQKKAAKAIRKVGGTMGEVKGAIKNAVDPMEKYVNQMYQKVKKADADERRAILIKGGTLPKIRRWVKRSIGLAAGAAVGTVIPAAAIATGIALIGFIATDKMLDAKEKRKLLREIEDELTVINEKIDDSRSDENKQNKYNLMRIRNDLQRTKERIILNLRE